MVTIIVNVASYCGYTESHYRGLVELWGNLKGEAVNILAFPCNQFGAQEPESESQIAKFAKGKGVEFEMPPTQQPWGGTLALFKDPDGNIYYLDPGHGG